MQADLRSFSRPAAFDVAINVYTSFGYCQTIEEDTQILRNIARSLKPGGYFILEMVGREIAVRDFTAGEWFERAGYTVLTDFSVEGAWEGLRSHWQLYTKDGLKADHTQPPNFGSLCYPPAVIQWIYMVILTVHPITNMPAP